MPQNRVLPPGHFGQLALDALSLGSTLLSGAVVHCGQISFDDAPSCGAEEAVGVESRNCFK
ncbi:hypothetical protein [Amycolatopsis speibonae]|uniref:Uncharacterized protein n=1 Tax=Amycolatopsis speibonae TaxID=1450224 RepID=A0ABV7NT81_9PSEU